MAPTVIFQAKTWIAQPIRAGFTLLELVVVILLLSIISVSAALSLQQPLINARLQRAVAALEDADRRARTQAQRLSSVVELRLDANQESTQLVTHTPKGPKRSEWSIGLDGGLHIDRMLSPKRLSADGALQVRFSPAGQSDTYAVRLRAGEGRKLWLVVVGVSGQYVRVSEDEVVEQLVSMQ